MLLWVVICTVVLMMLVPLYVLGRIARKRAEEVKAKFDEAEILLATSHTNFFGQESLGCKQVRGNGYLVLTRDVIYFMMLVPRREIVVSIQAVTGCEITKWHIGKSKSRPLLKVNFKNEQEETDSCAWLVADPEKWKAEIEELLKEEI